MSNNRDFGYMFSGCLSLTADLSTWDVRNAELMVEMFNGAASFTGEGLANWTLSDKVTDLEYMFNGAASFNGDISSWDVSRVQFMDYMVSFEWRRTFLAVYIYMRLLLISNRWHSLRAPHHSTKTCRNGTCPA
jgi:surface protein